MLRLTTIGLVLLLSGCLLAADARAQEDASGGPLMPEQAAYDVSFYDLDLEISPDRRAIDGRLEVHAAVTNPLKWFVLDLDTALTVDRLEIRTGEGWQANSFERRRGQIWTRVPMTRQPGEDLRVRIEYGGSPRVAPQPPWRGGFTWAETSSGAPWIGVSVQTNGADLWWPCKDHPSDEPDSMAISVTVPEPLVVASNGRLENVEKAGDRRTYHWLVSTPINNYGVSLNIAPYETIETTYTSVTGEQFPVIYWVLPENVEQGRQLMDQIKEHLRFFEEHFGPYPFRADKYGVAESPYLGMEHQTIIAYGNNYRNNAFGFDDLHHHELAHEWWGNMVTADDWKDFWIHEGFGTYTQAMYAGELQGRDAYHQYMQNIRPQLLNINPVAPGESRTTKEMYFISVGSMQTDNDIYYKGAWILHTLRYLIGEDAFNRALRRMAYPTPAAEKLTDGRQCRFATTDDFLTVAEKASGRELDWFFELYLRQPALPELISERSGGSLQLHWETPDDLRFPMPVEVKIGEDRRRVEMTNGRATLDIPAGETVEVDPDGWILRAR
jgi:aminopeptidase N